VLFLKKNILVTGGAGFIGSHLVDELVTLGHNVTIYDCLVPENFGDAQSPPIYMSNKARFIRANILDYENLKEAVKEADVVFHLASKLGIGKSMYEIRNFIQDNTLGTSNLLNILANENHSVKKLIVASSNSIYGEGSAVCEKCGIVKPKMREKEQLDRKDWNIKCPTCGSIVKSINTTENMNPDCTSIYAHTKMHQEQLCLLVGKAYSIDTTALRFFNVLGARQALSNPYTGVCAIFATSLLCGNPPLIYEDGKQSRDFVNVKDIVQALVLAITNPNAKNEIFNVGTGIATSVLQLAEKITQSINPNIKPRIVAQARFGDIRHCIADITKIKEKLGYKPKFQLEDSLKQVIEWVKLESKSKKLQDKSTDAEKELKNKGIL
jgi:dTDP-L-rhamnose 4-epimerase